MSTTFFFDLDNAESPSFSMTATHAGWMIETLGYPVDWADVMAGEAPARELQQRMVDFSLNLTGDIDEIRAMREQAPEKLSYVVGHIHHLGNLAQAAIDAGAEIIYWS